MSRFKIGQKVVCVKTHSQGTVIKGKTYMIENTLKICCTDLVDVGVLRNVTGNHECNCGKKFSKPCRNHAINENLFAPIQEDGSTAELTLEIEIKIEEFELETIELN